MIPPTFTLEQGRMQNKDFKKRPLFSGDETSELFN